MIRTDQTDLDIPILRSSNKEKKTPDSKIQIRSNFAIFVELCLSTPSNQR